MNRLWTLPLVAALALTGCSVTPPKGVTVTTSAGSTPASGAASSASTSTATTQTSAPAASDSVKAAQTLAASYDYDGALAKLAGDDSAEAKAAASEIAAAKASLVTWPNNAQVTHIFYHSLVIDAAQAFGPKTPQRVGYMQYMVTKKEFEAQLEQIYAKGYVLVHPQRLATKDAAGVMTWTPLALPPGKKPMVLSIDDVSYYKYMNNNGFASKLIIGDDGRVTNVYTDASGATTTGDYDVSTVLDSFVMKHPDFSYRGDKGTIALTGYEGVLGYRTSKPVYGDTAKTGSEIAEATKVADAMKAAGWKFASHSYGHKDFTKISQGGLEYDIKRWRSEVEPIVGRTDMLIYAFGADIGNYKPYTRANPKYAFLQDQGFDYFFPIDGTAPYWAQLQPGSLRQARINIDGITMSRALLGKQKVLPLLFDTASVWDDARPQKTP